jgi:predicted aspartyl protease
MRPIHLLCLFAALLVCRPAGAVDIDCALSKVAEMPLHAIDHLLVVPVGIDGKWTHLVVDTGAQRTTITAEAADRVGLGRDEKAAHTYIGVGGKTTSADAIVNRFVLGGVRIPLDRMAVNPNPIRTAGGADVDGLLGADILLAYEMDIDVPGQRLTLYRNRVCPGGRPPWPETPLEVLGVRRFVDRLTLPFTLDGVEGIGVIDTGAQSNVIGPRFAQKLRLTDQAMANDPVIEIHGTGGSAKSRLHLFKLWQIGPIADVAPRLIVLPSDFGVGDALIGEQFLEGRRVWLSFKNPQIFVTKRAQ